jgi:GrpB-like predicted nucleotidyltransferase (UPF0157 family)
MAHRAPVVIANHDERWPGLFAAERARLLGALPAGFEIEHVGSTSVPGLAAKPIVDMLLGGADLAAVDRVLPLLAQLGYDYRPEHEAVLPQRRYLGYPLTRPRQFHLHGVQQGGAFWREHLCFRDRLRAHPTLAAAYAALKRSLAQRFGEDREGYTAAKTGFIQRVLAGQGI